MRIKFNPTIKPIGFFKTNRKRSYLTYFVALLFFLIGGGVLIYALSPILYFHFPANKKIPYPSIFYPEENTKSDTIPADNRLVIPKIGVDSPIIEGENEQQSLSKGAWHYPNTVFPGEKGNMVITGHRFQFKPPNNKTFYLFDKLALEDKIIIYWERKEYNYQVTKIFEVEPEEIDLLLNGNEEKLTLFTCTPLFSTKKRLVIEAKRINNTSEENQTVNVSKRITITETGLEYLNVRRGPGTEYEVISKINAGEEFVELARIINNRNEEWIKINLRPDSEETDNLIEDEGWVIAKYVHKSDN